MSPKSIMINKTQSVHLNIHNESAAEMADDIRDQLDSKSVPILNPMFTPILSSFPLITPLHQISSAVRASLSND